MITAPVVTITLTALTVTTFAAAIARILRDVSWHTLAHYCRANHREQRLEEIYQQESRVLLGMETLELLAILSTVTAGYNWWESVPHQHSWYWTLVPCLVGVIVMLAATIWVPQAVSRWWGVYILTWCWPVCKAVGRALLPLAAAADLLTHVAGRLQGQGLKLPTKHEREKVLENEIRSIVREGIRDGLFQRDALDMIEGVMLLDDNRVNGIMTPRSEMDTLNASMSWNEMLAAVSEFQRTRIPVLEGPEAEDVVGVLYVKDLLFEMSRQDTEHRRPWRELLRPIWYVPATQPVDELLKQFLHDRSHLAMVRDEFGNVVGLVTIEDALEEIVGEIVDESDEAVDGPNDNDICEINDHSFEISARLSITDVNDRMGTHLPENQDFDTVAGFVLRRIGRIPKLGERLDWEQYKITVIKSTPRQIERLRFERTKQLLRREPAIASAAD